MLRCPQHVFNVYFGHQNGSAFNLDSTAALNIHIFPDRISNLSRNIRPDNTLYLMNVDHLFGFLRQGIQQQPCLKPGFLHQALAGNSKQSFFEDPGNMNACCPQLAKKWERCRGLPKLVDHRTLLRRLQGDQKEVKMNQIFFRQEESSAV